MNKKIGSIKNIIYFACKLKNKNKEVKIINKILASNIILLINYRK